jgi:hypothetical protein
MRYGMQTLPWFNQFSHGNLFKTGDATVLGLLAIIFGITSRPIDVPLWFLRDLILLVLCAPIIDFVLKRISLLYLSVVGASWLGLLPRLLPGTETSPLATRAILFFSLGIFLAQRGLPSGPSLRVRRGLSGMFATAVIVQSLAYTNHWFTWILPQMTNLLGVACCWWGAEWIKHSAFHWTEVLVKGAKYSFFIFASHTLTLTFARKLMTVFFHPAGGTQFLVFLYFISAVLAVGMSIIAYEALRVWLPSFLRLLTGRRAEVQRAAVKPELGIVNNEVGTLGGGRR